MDLRYQLMQEMSRFNMHYIAESINGDKEIFADLIYIVLNEKDPLPPRAAWVAEIVTRRRFVWIYCCPIGLLV